MRRVVLAISLLSLLLVGLLAISGTTSVQANDVPTVSSADSSSTAPRYAADGKLLRPEGTERWVFVGASLGLSYSEHARESDPGSFHHVYLEPGAYDHFTRTGAFPEKTMLVLEIHERADRAEPSRQGYFEGERLAFEVALKDSERFDGGWAYFDFSNGRQAASPFPARQCANCHAQHADDDNVFTQFYPVLRRAKEER